MKTPIYYLLVFFCIFFNSKLTAQTNTKIIPDLYGLMPSTSHHIIANSGQLVNDESNSVSDINHYTFSSTLNHYFFQDKVVTTYPVYSNANDSVPPHLDSMYRFDFLFKGSYNPAPTINVYQQDNPVYNFYLPQCSTGITNLNSYRRIVYENIYNNIDYNFYSSENGIVHYMVVYPSGNSNDIEFKFNGYDAVSVYDTYLQGTVGSQTFTIDQPIAYQFDASLNTILLPWKPNFVATPTSTIKLQLTGAYDNTLPLVFIFNRGTQSGVHHKNRSSRNNLDWATIFGNWAAGIKIDSDGNIYVATQDNTASFPVTPGKNLPSGGGTGDDIQLAKFNGSCVMQWVSIIGSSGTDFNGDLRNSIAIKSNNHIYVGSETGKADLPLKTKSGAYNESVNDCDNGLCQDMFIAEFLPSNGSLNWCTYYGGASQDELMNDMTVDGNDNLYIVGNSHDSYLKTKSGATNSTSGACVIAKFNSSDDMDWATRFGSSGVTSSDEESIFSAICNDNNLYVTGWTSNGNFPTLNAYQSTISNSNGDAIVAKFDNNNLLSWSTFFGGQDVDQGLDLDFFNGNLYVGGITASTENNGFPTYKDASYNGYYDATYNGGYYDGFLANFTPSGSLVSSSFMGGSGLDATYCVTNCKSDLLLVGGTTSSQAASSSSFPLTSTQNTSLYLDNSLSNAPNNKYDAFIMSLNNSGKQNWGSYYGTKITENGEKEKIFDAVVANNYLYIVGRTPMDGTGLDLFAPSTSAYLKKIGSSTTAAFILRFNLNNITLSTNSFISKSPAKIYPNPTSGKVYISLPDGKHYLCSLSDITGKEVKSFNSGSAKQFSFDISDLTKGVYLLKLESEDHQNTMYEKICLY